MSAEETGGRKRGLARGLSALLGDTVIEDAAPAAAVGDIRMMPIERLHPGRYQPRRHFDEEALAQLAASLRERGVVQPILVRPVDDGRFEIVAGERRWRAAQIARLHEVPVIVRHMADHDALEIALVENIQRQDLTPLEEAEGYRRLMGEFSYTQEELGRVIGKSRAHVANMLRLLNLPDAVKEMLDDGRLTMGHARAIATAEDPASLARRIVDRGLTVRNAEDLARGDAEKRAGRDGSRKPAGGRPRKAAGDAAPTAAAGTKDADTLRLEEDLSETLGLKVTITPSSPQAGMLSVSYGSLEDLDDLLARLTSRG
ncbi:ParB/RepB/Spo0J family partition protein [Tistrella bauzanensis]|uniref:ParB/RepB/Spo0J family partition protein n=1 Tax=Tistrella arctica TaxID=3133430 RepID=A0ABU9YGW5_9PROT